MSLHEVEMIKVAFCETISFEFTHAESSTNANQAARIFSTKGENHDAISTE